MFQDILETAQKNIDTVRCILKTNEQLRDSIYSPSEDDDLLIKKLKENAPNILSWAVFDHCASVTRLYAIYEQFVEDLIRDWLKNIPKLYKKYSELPDRIKDTHQLGVGKILIDLKKDKYKNFSLEAVIRVLLAGVTEQEVYELLPDAFVIHEQNLRKDILEKLFTESGVDNTWNWLKNSRHIKRFVTDNQTTAEGELKKLITLRNEAAHRGNIDYILGFEELRGLCDFLEVLCQALAELVSYQVIKKRIDLKQAIKIGEITEWFSKSKAAVLKSEIGNINLSIGQEVFLIGEACCQSAKIENIHINDTPVNQVQTIQEMEIGLKLSVAAKKDLKIYLIR